MDASSGIYAFGNFVTVKIGIIGSGFGVYGYLPAAASIGWDVITLKRYKDTILARTELSNYWNKISFMDSEKDLIEHSSRIVVAQTPEMQFNFIRNFSQDLKRVSHLYLEKPLTNNLNNSKSVLNFLRSNELSFSLGYIFLHTEWFQTLSKLLETSGNVVRFKWSIPSPNSNWKSRKNLGGGINHFFLIHLIPVLSNLGFPISKLETGSIGEKSFLRVSDRNLVEVFAEIVSKDFIFEIYVNDSEEPIFKAETPFGMKPQIGTTDPRIVPLQKYLVSAIDGIAGSHSSFETELEVLAFLKICEG
jgi:hypothetical protein